MTVDAGPAASRRAAVRRSGIRDTGTGTPFTLIAPAVLGVALLILPLLALITRASWATLWQDITSPVAVDALRLSLVSGLAAGGVSAGAYEVVKQSLEDAMEFTKVAMQPGKPQGFGATGDGMLLFGLPGNPVSAAVSFEVFVRPALLRMQGRDAIHRPRRHVPAGVEWRTPPGRRQYLPAVIDRTDPARPTVRPATAGGSGSHLSVGLGAADAYAIVPAETERVSAGDLIEVMEL